MSGNGDQRIQHANSSFCRFCLRPIIIYMNNETNNYLLPVALLCIGVKRESSAKEEKKRWFNIGAGNYNNRKRSFLFFVWDAMIATYEV